MGQEIPTSVYRNSHKRRLMILNDGYKDDIYCNDTHIYIQVKVTVNMLACEMAHVIVCIYIYIIYFMYIYII